MVGGGTSERMKRMNRLRSRLGLLVVLVLLAAPGLAQAKPSADQGPAVTHEAGLFDRAWHWMASVLMKAGSFIDPAGINSGTGSPQPTSSTSTDAGSFIDPAGGS